MIDPGEGAVTAGYRMRRAERPDLAEIMAILESRRRWLDEVKHSDQWAHVDAWRILISHLIGHGNTFVLCEDDAAEQHEIVGTITLSTDPDHDFWLPEERSENALYLSKLATAPEAAGHELGGIMLEWAVARAAAANRTVVRLDTWRTSDALQGYYLKRGWDHLRTEVVDHRRSGALFEKRTGLRAPDAGRAHPPPARPATTR